MIICSIFNIDFTYFNDKNNFLTYSDNLHKNKYYSNIQKNETFH